MAKNNKKQNQEAEENRLENTENTEMVSLDSLSDSAEQAAEIVSLAELLQAEETKEAAPTDPDDKNMLAELLYDDPAESEDELPDINSIFAGLALQADEEEKAYQPPEASAASDALMEEDFSDTIELSDEPIAEESEPEEDISAYAPPEDEVPVK